MKPVASSQQGWLTPSLCVRVTVVCPHRKVSVLAEAQRDPSLSNCNTVPHNYSFCRGIGTLCSWTIPLQQLLHFSSSGGTFRCIQPLQLCSSGMKRPVKMQHQTDPVYWLISLLSPKCVDCPVWGRVMVLQEQLRVALWIPSCTNVPSLSCLHIHLQKSLARRCNKAQQMWREPLLLAVI